MKVHIGVDDESDLVHSVVGTVANVADVTQVDKLLPGEENMVAAAPAIPVSKSVRSMRVPGDLAGCGPPQYLQETR